MKDEKDIQLFAKEVSQQEFKQEFSLRPKNFQEFIGQEKVVSNIELMIGSAQIRQKPVDHILLSGPPGLGKTSLAYLMAENLGVNLHVLTGPSIDKKGDLAAALTNLSERDILFIDEIHRLPMVIEEILYSAMEDFRLDILIGQGPSARAMQIDLTPFTLMGATTRSGLLSAPLRDRFMAHLNFNFYTSSELSKIIKLNSLKMGVNLSESGANLVATRSRGTPRIANRILRRVRDYSLVKNIKKMSEECIENALDLLQIDKLGLDSMDRNILEVIKIYYGGGPVGIEALCATLGEDRGTIEDVYEPFLLQRGLLLRTPRGRAITELGKKHLASL